MVRTFRTVLICTALLAGGIVDSARAATLVFEGENYSWIKPSMRVAQGDEGASKQKYVYIPLRPGHGETEQGPTNDGNTTYKIYIPTEANYTLWARVKWHDGCGNSFYVMVDNLNPENAPYITDNAYQKWHWVKGRTYHLTKGYHRFRFQYREDGAKLDQFLITTASPEEWVPTRKLRETPGYLWKPEPES